MGGYIPLLVGHRTPAIPRVLPEEVLPLQIRLAVAFPPFQLLSESDGSVDGLEGVLIDAVESRCGGEHRSGSEHHIADACDEVIDASEARSIGDANFFSA